MQHSPFCILSMALSTPSGTALSSASPTTKLTSRESNSRPPQLPSRCTERQSSPALVTEASAEPHSARRLCQKAGAFTVDPRSVVGVEEAVTFDLDPSHDPTVVHQILSFKLQQFHLWRHFFSDSVSSHNEHLRQTPE